MRFLDSSGISAYISFRWKMFLLADTKEEWRGYERKRNIFYTFIQKNGETSIHITVQFRARNPREIEHAELPYMIYTYKT